MNFLDLEPEHSDAASARAAVLPLPYEKTTSYGTGTARGPAAIIAASQQVEVFDELRGRTPAEDLGIATLDAFTPSAKTPEACVDEIEAAVAAELRDGRLLCALGGEHALSVGVARALAKAGGDDLCAVVLDAHSDLRDEYEGTKYSHACATRRISEVMPALVVGLRSISAGCAEFLESSDRVDAVYADEIVNAVPAAAVAGFCRGKRVFLSIDLDCLDPSVMPATGTPEPGGLTWWQVLGIIDEVARSASEVAALDIVELSPIDGLAAPDFLAARLTYKAITAALLGPADEADGADAAGAAGAD